MRHCNTFLFFTSSMVKDRIEEKRLLYRVQSEQEADAFAELYRRYIEKIYRFVFFKVGDRQNSEDIVSDVFLKTWNYLTDDERAPVDSFSGFLYQVARNAVVDWYRDRNPAGVPLHEVEEGGTPAASVLEERVDTAQHAEQIYRAIQRLKHEYQEVVHLRYIDEMSIGEIAAITGKGRVAVRVTLHRAMKKLKEMLDTHT